MTSTYRDDRVRTLVLDSSDEGEVSSGECDSDEVNAVLSPKRNRLDAPVVKTDYVPVVTSDHANGSARPKRSKNVNIWGSVLAEQSSNDISSSLGAVGMERFISRGPESFDLPATFKDDLDSGSSSDEDQHQYEQKNQTHLQSEKKKRQNGVKTCNKRKRKLAKNKNNTPAYKPGQKVTLNKRCDLSDTDPVDKVSEEIAFRLWERKKDLVRSLTETLGVPLAIDLYNKTEDIEKNGGLLTLQGTRRRTPGGTFIHLVRNDPRVDQEPIRKVFDLESERDRMHWEVRKQQRKTKKADGTKATNSDAMAMTQNNLAASETMECNDATMAVEDPAMDRDVNHDHVHKCPQDGAGDVKISNSSSSAPADVELSEGEIPDSDEENANAESFG